MESPSSPPRDNTPLPVPSPTKKQAVAIPAFVRDPNAIRGSLARQASIPAETADALRFNAMRARAAVSRGHQRPSDLPNPSTARRGLVATQSAPSLSFAPPSFHTTDETLEAVFGFGGGRREVQPLWETGSPGSSRGGSFVSGTTGSGMFSVASDGYRTRETTQDVGEVEESFDMEDVFGSDAFDIPTRNGPLSFGDDAQGESQESTSTTATIVGGLKRAFEEAVDEDDIEMEATDVEDEGEDEPVSALAAPIGRALAGRRGLSKTQSLPGHLFSSSAF